MNAAAIPEFVNLWLVVNVGAFLLLAVMAYFGSTFMLDRLERIDRWMYAKEHGHNYGAEFSTSQDIPKITHQEGQRLAGSLGAKDAGQE